MLAIRLARKTLQKATRSSKKPGLNKKYSPLSCGITLYLHRDFHSSPKHKWISPDELNIQELKRECERRKISTQGSKKVLTQRLKDYLDQSGGHDNGLTLDADLVKKKREIETEINRIPDKYYTTAYLYVEDRYQKKLKSKFDDQRIRFHHDKPSHVCIEGRYADVCHLRSQIAQACSEMSSKETVYSLPHYVVTRLKKILGEIRRTHDVSFSILRHKSNNEEMMLVAVEGAPEKRILACDALEEVIDKIKSHSIEIPTSDSNDKSLMKLIDKHSKNDDILSPYLLRESVADCYNVFQGVVLYLDPRMREMMRDYQNRLDTVAKETNTNIYLGSRDLFWLNDYQLAIEGNKKDVAKARQQVDQLLNHLKALTMTLVLPPTVNEDIAKESKVLANSLQKTLGVDTVIIQQHDHIYVHLIGTTQQVNGAACVIDSRAHRLIKLRSGDNERSKRRERIKNLNFVELGVGGLDETLKTMLRRTFESRLISQQLRKELDLQHIKGVLLYGQPGTGKTLIARKISQILGCNEPKIVNGPEVESKWVGEAEKNIRNLFDDARTEFLEKGENSDLHVIIFDEIDAIAKKRGGAHAKSRDGALNQLLCCMDGIQSLDNVLVFGLTNRKDSLDPALLRPGRLEVQLEIGLPSVQGREDILKIHTKRMREHGRLAPNVNLKILAEYADQFSGADLSGMVRSAVSYALDELKDEDNVVITQEMLQRGLDEIRYSKERLPSDEEPDAHHSGLLQA